jgi:diguanylate cyclase
MSVDHGSDGYDPSGARKLLLLIDALRDSATGEMIYAQIERMLNDMTSNHVRVQQAYVALVNALLAAYLSHLKAGSRAFVEVKLLQSRIQPPLTFDELTALSEYVDRSAGQLQGEQEIDTTVFRDAMGSLLAAFGIGETAGSEPHREDIGTVEQGIPATDRTPVAAHLAEAGREPEPEYIDEAAAAEITGEEEAEGSTELDQAHDDSLSEYPLPHDEMTGTGGAGGFGEEEYAGTGFRSHLDARHDDIQKLQATLAGQVLEAITQNEEFGVMLELVLKELRQVDNIKSIEDLRWSLIREVQKLMTGHNELADKLDSTHHYLQVIETDSRQLNDELTRVRLLSLTDELTSLPNRRAFLRRMEDEVARVQRYGFPLSLALIDLDNFKSVNDDHGHAAGDEVLRVYSRNILSIFRHHDLVARYGGEEFAVLLPNTDGDGSLRALGKVRKRAAETRWQTNGTVMPVPSFSAGLAVYKPGETANAFIERADRALYRAKRHGRDRVEMDMTYQTGGGDNDADEMETTGPPGQD